MSFFYLLIKALQTHLLILTNLHIMSLLKLYWAFFMVNKSFIKRLIMHFAGDLKREQCLFKDNSGILNI